MLDVINYGFKKIGYNETPIIMNGFQQTNHNII